MGSSKDKTILILQYLMENTSESNSVTNKEIELFLNNNGITINRKTLSSTLNSIRNLGFNIHTERKDGLYVHWYEKSELTQAETRVVIDAVRGASFISNDKTKEIIKKLLNINNSKQIEKEVKKVIFFDNKTDNKEIFDTISILSKAIQEKRQIKFDYVHKVLRGENINKDVIRNPVQLVFTNNFYYLICYGNTHTSLGNYRIDRIRNIKLLDDRIVEPLSDQIKNFDLEKHLTSIFNMYGGESVDVSLVFNESLIPVFYDKFGKNLRYRDFKPGYKLSTRSIQISPQFFGWISSFAGEVYIEGPNNIKQQYKEFLEKNINNL